MTLLMIHRFFFADRCLTDKEVYLHKSCQSASSKYVKYNKNTLKKITIVWDSRPHLEQKSEMHVLCKPVRFMIKQIEYLKKIVLKILNGNIDNRSNYIHNVLYNSTYISKGFKYCV